MKAISAFGLLLCLFVVVLTAMDFFSGRFNYIGTIPIGFPAGFEFNVPIDPDEIEQHIVAAGEEQKHSALARDNFRNITVALQRFSEILAALIAIFITTGVGQIVPSGTIGKSYSTPSVWVANPIAMKRLSIMALSSAVLFILSSYTGDVAAHYGDKVKNIREKTLFTINKIRQIDDETIARQLLVDLEICYRGKCNER